MQITTHTELRAAIVQLEQKQAEQGKLLKEQFNLAYNSVKPMNLIMSALEEAYESEDLRKSLLTSTIGLGATYLSKKFMKGKGTPSIKRFLRSAFMMSITNVIAKNPDIIKLLGKSIMQLFRSKPGSPETEHDIDDDDENETGS